MKKLGITAILVFFFILIGCGGGSGGNLTSDTELNEASSGGTYTASKSNVAYTLDIIPAGGRSTYKAGDSYELKVIRGDTEKLSAGKVAELNGKAAVLQPSYKDAPVFSITASGKNITNITGLITFNDGSSEAGPGAFGGGGGGGGGSGGGTQQPDTPVNPFTPTITSVTILPGSPTVAKGTSQQFRAVVSGFYSPAQTVTWNWSGGGDGTSLSSNGVLTVAANESASSLNIRATSTVDPSKFSSWVSVRLSAPGTINAITPLLELSQTSYSVSRNSPLTVSANVSNISAINAQHTVTGGGTLSIQWYSNVPPSSPISGATGLSYSPSTSANGFTTYYLVVTNTIAPGGDGGQKTATVSAPVTIMINSGGVPPFTAVDSITGVPTSRGSTAAFPLSGTVNPVNATNKTIQWSIIGASTNMTASLNGNMLAAQMIGQGQGQSDRGTVTVRATIGNGLSQGNNYSQDFVINYDLRGQGGQGNNGSNLPPSDVIVSAALASSVTLSWSPAVSNPNAQGPDQFEYYVYRSSSVSGPYNHVGTTSSTSYTDTSLAPNTVYYYSVSAFDGRRESPQSSVVSARTYS